jgi:hypothetical protein
MRTEINFLLICAQIFFLFILTGCTFHIKYFKEYPELSLNNKIIVDEDKKICVIYDENAFIKLDVMRALTNSNLAFDYGDSMKKIGEKYFSKYEHIDFISIDENLTNNTRCEYAISAEVEKAIYTYFYKPTHRELNVTMKYQIQDINKNLTYEETYNSGTMIVPWSMISEYMDLADVFTTWIYDRIVVIINELNEME